jgi:glucokinase
MGDYAVGIDIGGTTVVGAALRRDGQMIARRDMPTDSRRGSDDGLRRLGALVAALLDEAGITPGQIAGIGVGSSGPIDAASGTIHNPYTLPGWDGIPVVAALRDRFGVPACLLGDCQIAALGEHWRGAGQSARNMVYMTVGTGVGGALIVEGRLYRGLGDANEIGHQVIDVNGPECYCGGRGCVEVLASGPAIARRAAAEAPDGSLLLTLAGGDRAQISARLVVEASARGDSFAQSLVEQIGTVFGHGLANVINSFAPDHVVLGGGVMLGWSAFAPAALAVIERRCQIVPLRQVQIVTAQLGLNAGVTGAARAVWMMQGGAMTRPDR